MLKGETLTTIKEFIQRTHTITDANRFVFTYYVIQYDGTNECRQDISRFIGGFPYGDLTMIDSCLFSQYKYHDDTRKLSECICNIEIGDYVCLSCNKFFVIDEREFNKCIRAWDMQELPFDLSRFKEIYGRPEDLLGVRLYDKTYRKQLRRI